LVIDDEKSVRTSLQALLEDEGYAVRAVESAEQGLALCEREKYLLAIVDGQLGGISGYEFLERARQRWPELPVVLITAFATPKYAVQAIKQGALDYLAKPYAPEEMLHAVERCVERHRLLQENAALRARVVEPYHLDQIIGQCPGMVELRRLIQTVAPSNATVLILGESGTGKELVAGALHSLSPRRSAPYVRINCAAIPETLLESELFGHEKGAFTGAVRQKQGRVEEANGGTIFLDEIGDMSRSLQAKLLRFLEDGTFTRVGGTQELHVDVRLLAATNRDITAAIRQNQFREDLYHRLNVVQCRPPPLRERGGDVLLLAEHFLRQFCAAMNKSIRGLAPTAQQKLLSHRWPGNVRELRNAIERAVILETSAELRAASLPDFTVESALRPAETPGAPAGQSLDEMLSNFERDLIMKTLERARYNLNRTAEQLKLSRHALRYRMQRLKLQPDLVTDEDDAAPAAQAKEVSP
jgi:DNA-binding NtrC family response regulator